MNTATARILVLIGSLLLALGAFLPLVSIPLSGQLNMFDLPLAGIVLAACAGAALLLGALDLQRLALIPGLGALATMGFAYVRVQARIEETRLGLERLDIRRPMDLVRGAAATQARLEFGWAVLVMGALMVVAGGVMAWRAHAAAKTAARVDAMRRG